MLNYSDRTCISENNVDKVSTILANCYQVLLMLSYIYIYIYNFLVNDMLCKVFCGYVGAS